MNAHDVRTLIRECERMAGIADASSHKKARIWREVIDKASGQVTRDPAALLSPVTLAMNRLYDGRGIAATRHTPRAP